MSQTQNQAELEGLIRIETDLNPNELECRVLYATREVIARLDDILDEVRPLKANARKRISGRQTPREQLDDIFHQFISGNPMNSYPQAHIMQPPEFAVWELKSDDLRVFGWFWKKGTFIISDIVCAKKTKTLKLYDEFRDRAISLRKLLRLDEPAYMSGGYDDVF